VEGLRGHDRPHDPAGLRQPDGHDVARAPQGHAPGDGDDDEGNRQAGSGRGRDARPDEAHVPDPLPEAPARHDAQGDACHARPRGGDDPHAGLHEGADAGADAQGHGHPDAPHAAGRRAARRAGDDLVPPRKGIIKGTGAAAAPARRPALDR
jgi:hypothetical protein